MLSERDEVQQVSVEQNEKLIKPVSTDETYWNVIGEDVVECCQKFMITGELPTDVNKTVVCLIPKVKQPRKVTDLRPISLCNVIIRIMSKIMANRLKECLPILISDKQSAFVEGRLLTGNALVAFELNHYIKRKRQRGIRVVGFKIDIAKAYDKLEWPFLEAMMEKIWV
ncbi:hypothetical protein AgCh_030148 [Apium graveolens]